MRPRQLPAHNVLCPGCSPVDSSERDLLLQKALFLSQFLRLFMIIDGIFLILWAIIAWPFFLGLLLIICRLLRSEVLQRWAGQHGTAPSHTTATRTQRTLPCPLTNACWV